MAWVGPLGFYCTTNQNKILKTPHVLQTIAGEPLLYIDILLLPHTLVFVPLFYLTTEVKILYSIFRDYSSLLC